MSIVPYLFLISVITASISGVSAAISDIKTLQISNQYSVIIIAAFCVSYGVCAMGTQPAPFEPLISHIAGFIIVLAMTYTLYALKIMGGADSKLLSAFALWVGIGGLAALLFMTALAGGALSLITLVIAKTKPLKSGWTLKLQWISAAQNGKGKIPYAAAITIGSLITFWRLGYFSYAGL